MRLVLGLFKGIIIGGLLALGASEAGLGGGFLVYGLIGFAVGVLVGRPLWSHLTDKNSTVVVSVLKGIVGFGVGTGLYFLVDRVLGSSRILGSTGIDLRWYAPILGAAIGGVYGAWVELDDAPSAGKDGKPEPPAKKA